jgi:DNA-binding beta-propeller fold protein YncE
MKTLPLYSITLAAILIFSMYTIPNNFGEAYAHQSGRHEACWDGQFNLIYLILSIVGFVIIVVLLAVAAGLIASLFAAPVGFKILAVDIPLVQKIFLGLKILSVIPGVFLARACDPMIIQPPVTQAGTVHLDCNTEAGFAFNKIENNEINDRTAGKYSDRESEETKKELVCSRTGPRGHGGGYECNLESVSPNTLGFVEPTIKSDTVDRELPPVYWYSFAGVLSGILIIFIVSIILEAATLSKPPADGVYLAAAIKALAKSKLVNKLYILALVLIISTLYKFTKSTAFGPSPFSWFGVATSQIRESAFTTHAFATIDEMGARESPGQGNQFEIGKNSLEYYAKTDVGKEDKATFPFNVYDSEPPKIIFGPKNVTVEANAHFGFKVNSKTRPLIQQGLTVRDNCDPNPQLEPLGADFYLLTKIKKDQYYQWKTWDTPPTNNYYALTNDDIKRVLDKEIMDFTNADYKDQRVAAWDPNQTFEFSNVSEEFSTARHLFAKITNDAIDELINNNTNQLPPTADVVLDSGLTDVITGDDIGIIGAPELDSEMLIPTVAPRTPLTISSLSDEKKAGLRNLSKPPSARPPSDGSFFNFIPGYDTLMYGQLRPNTLDTETATQNIFVDFQYVTVVDTIPPNILVTEDISLEVNSTNVNQTRHTNVDFCTGTVDDDNIECQLTITPPAVFDIADPFPTFFENVTSGTGDFNSVETLKLTAKFPLGPTFIAWKAIDFSGNGNKTEDAVIQIVNMKLNGTNFNTEVFDVNATVFATVPEQITIIAQNNDTDPLKFIIEQDPENGILDTPIDAVFLTKFQIFGAVSKLKGITNDILSGDIFFTDFLNQRVMMMDDREDLQISFDLPQITSPEAISITGTGNFMISDWPEEIIKTTDNGTTLEKFNVTGFFVDPEFLSVDQNTGHIYVTDSQNGTITKLNPFDIFGQPQGIEVHQGNDNKIYVVDRTKNLVNLFNPSGIFENSFSGGFSNPNDITVNDDGNIYVLDTGNNRIVNFSSNLEFSGEFGPKGNGLDFFNGPKGISISGNDIFVVDTGNHQIKKIINFTSPIIENYNSTAGWVTTGNQVVIFPAINPDRVRFYNDTAAGINSLNYTYKNLGTLDKTWSAEFTLETGNLVDASPVFLWSLTNNTNHPLELTSQQDALGVIYENKNMTLFSKHGNTNLFSSNVTGLKNNTTYFVNLERPSSDLLSMVVFETSRTNPQFGNVSFTVSNQISDLQILQHANSPVVNKPNPEVEITQSIINPVVTWLGKCTSGPNCVAGSSENFMCTDTTCFGSGQGVLDEQFTSPRGITANSTHILVTDDHRVQIFNKSGVHTTTLGSVLAGTSNDAFDNPNDIEIDPLRNRIIVTDTNNDRYKVYDENGNFLNKIEGTGTFLGNLTLPSGLGVDRTGIIYVSDAGNNRILKFDSDGNFLNVWKSSINSKFGEYIETIELYVPNIQADALDLKDRKVMIGDWSTGKENVIITNSSGGKLTKFDISSLVQKPHSLTVNSTNAVYITDPPSKNIVVLNSAGNKIKDIDVSNVSGFNITPTGITKAKDIEFSVGSSTNTFSDEKIFVFDNSSEKIYAITEGSPDTADFAFDAKNLFENLNDITVNGTHVFGLQLNNMSNIVQIRWDKGILNTADIGENVTGISIGKDMNSELLFFTTKNQADSSLFSINASDNAITRIINLTDFNVEGYGIATNPVLTQLVDVAIEDDNDFGLMSPKGLAFSPDNKTFAVVSSTTNEIKVINTTTNELITTIVDFNLIKNPTDIIYDPNGNLLVASSSNNLILEVNVTNDDIATFLQGSNMIISPSGLAVSNDKSHLFVSNGFDDTIMSVRLVNATIPIDILNPDTGLLETQEISIPGQTRGSIKEFVNSTNISSLDNPQYLALGPDNNLYVSSYDSDEVLRWFPNGTSRGVFGEASKNGTSKLEGPTGIVFSPDGKYMFVSSQKTNQVLKFDFNTGEFIGTFSDVQTFAPEGLVFGPNGNLFVSSLGSNEVLEYGDSEILYYIADWTPNVHKIIGFNSTGDIVGTPLDVNKLQLTSPQNIAADKSGKVWIADAGVSPRLIQFDVIADEVLNEIYTTSIVEIDAPDLTLIPNSDPQKWRDDKGNEYDEFIEDVITSLTPKGISLDIHDNLYITDWDNHRIVVINSGENFLGQVRLNSTFTDPMDIVINQTNAEQLDNIWVYDANFTGNELGTLISLDVNKQFEKLEFIDEVSPFLRGLTMNGTTLVTTPTNSGSIFNIEPTKEAHFDSKHFIIPMGIDITNNEILVSDWKEQRIVELDKSGDFTQEFDFKRVGFVTDELGDVEINESDEFFWIGEPRRATIDQIGFLGTGLAFPSVSDKYVIFSSIDVDKQDNFYVTGNDTVKKFDIRGDLLAKSTIDLTNKILVDVVLGPVPSTNSESVFLATAGPIGSIHNQIIKFNKTSLETQAAPLPLGFMPTSVTVDNDGFIYVSSSNLEILKFNENFFPQFPTVSIPSSIPGGSISDMFVDSKNALYATDRELDRIYKMNLTDNSLMGWLGKCTLGSDETKCDVDSRHSKGFVCNDTDCINNDLRTHGRDVGQFFEPTGLTIDGLNNVYVADVKLSRDNAAVDDPMVNFTDIFNRGNVPRVQKFTQNGFYVEQVISDTNQTLVKGNFEWVEGIAYGTNFFYVADVEKLHVFEVNPFSNIFTNTTTNMTSAQVTYESFIELGMSQNKTDDFLFKAFDGFNNSNVAKVNVTIINPDQDNDGLLGDIDLDNKTISFDFKSFDGTNGTIVTNGTQILTIREDRDPEKGVYTQADIRGGATAAKVRYCDNLAEIILKPGNRVVVTCTLGGENGETMEGIEVDIIRGEVDVTFFDREGRSSNSKIRLDNTIFFSPDPFEFISGEKNLDIISQKVHFNNKNHQYLVPKDSTVRIDTAPPILPISNCNNQLMLEADYIEGVRWTVNPQNPIDNGLSNQFDKIFRWLNFSDATREELREVDNGSTPETDGNKVIVTNNATALFEFTPGTLPTNTAIEFFVVDKIGNNNTCINTINVRDTTKPEIRFDPGFSGQVLNETGAHSELGVAEFKLPKIFDLPASPNGVLAEVTENETVCGPTSGSEFLLGNTTVICGGMDLSGVGNAANFTVIISANQSALSIKNVTVIDNSGVGLTQGDNIMVEFTMPTNQPPATNLTEITKFLDVSSGDLGNDVSGVFVDPSNLFLTINDISPPVNLVPGQTKFDLNFTPDYLLLQSASGALNSTGFNQISNPITLTGSFATVANAATFNFGVGAPPYITAFLVNDPLVDNTSTEYDAMYSIGDVFTIRFSEPTNAPGIGNILDTDQVNKLFDFSPFVLGSEYVGKWKNPSTFEIEIIKIMPSIISEEPVIGTTQVKVKASGNIKNRAETSDSSTAISPFLSGSFGEFYVFKTIKQDRMFSQTLPSGVSLGIQMPANLTTVNATATGGFLRNAVIETTGLIPVSEFIEVSIANEKTTCLLGCKISFFIHSSDLPREISLGQLRIIHDADDNGVIGGSEILVPEIQQIRPNLFRISATVTIFSPIGLVGLPPSGGSGGDEIPPDFKTFEVITCDPEIGCGTHVAKEVKFENDMPTAHLPIGHTTKLILRAYENSGVSALQHVTMYLNLQGLGSKIQDSDTYVRYNKGSPITVKDPNGFFSDAKIFVSPRGENIDVNFFLTFDKPLEKSDIIIRAWDYDRNSRDAIFRNAIIVEEIHIPEDKITELTELVSENIPQIGIIPQDIIAKWAGYSGEVYSDKQLLEYLEIKGTNIPNWVKDKVSNWVYDGSISQTEFINALKFLSQGGMLEG